MVSLCLNSLPLPPSSFPKNITETCLTSSSYSNGSVGTTLKLKPPIVVSGNPPTFVSAPARRIVAGSFSLFITPCVYVNFQFHAQLSWFVLLPLDSIR